MRITIHSTDMYTRVDGVKARIWRGVTEAGVPCDLAIPMIRVRDDQNGEQFERELKQIGEPTVAVSMRQVW